MERVVVDLKTGAITVVELTPDEVSALPAPVKYVPQTVSRFQARAALLAAGLLDTVTAYMAQPETPQLVKLAWEDAQEFSRTSPTVLGMQTVLGISDDQLDDLFIQAETITA